MLILKIEDFTRVLRGIDNQKLTFNKLKIPRWKLWKNIIIDIIQIIIDSKLFSRTKYLKLE